MKFELTKVTNEDLVNGKIVIPKYVTSLGKSFFEAKGEIVFEENSSLEIIKKFAFSTSIYQNELNLKNLKHLKVLEDKSLIVYSSYHYPHIKIILPDTLEKIGFEVFHMQEDELQEISVSFKTNKIDLMFALNDNRLKRKFLDNCYISFYDFEEYAPKETLFKPKMTIREFENAIETTISQGKNLIN